MYPFIKCGNLILESIFVLSLFSLKYNFEGMKNSSERTYFIKISQCINLKQHNKCCTPLNPLQNISKPFICVSFYY